MQPATTSVRLHSVNGEAVDLIQVRRDVEACCRSQAALLDHLRAIGPIDPSVPSRLPAWTVGHVLTHIARNADGHVSMLDGHPQYPHGADGRTADIDSGATRSWRDLVDDVARTNARLEQRWATHGEWGGTAELLSGTRPTALLPFLRQREVEVHRVDLGLGYEFDALPADYLRQELRLLGMLWKARQPMGMTPLPDLALAAPPSTRLAWLMGRTEIDGLPPAQLF
jgi:maleylpyruvate isomerase